MKTNPEFNWKAVSKNLIKINQESETNDWLNEGQRKSIASLAKHLPNNGMLIADEVGMGKTRIAVALARAVKEAGGRVAVLIPSGLGYQWQEEFRLGKLNDVPDPIRSLDNYFKNWPEAGWYSKEILLISHLFSNWRHQENSSSWRLALLPEVYARVRKEKNKIPRNYYDYSKYYCRDGIKTKAEQIVDAIPANKSNPARKKLELLRDLPWSEDLYLGNSYTNKDGEELRNYLKNCVGLGLGIFDLIIVDEAHKNRGASSGLNKLLDHIICRAQDSRVVGLTATPVELELEDWLSTLNRIGINGEETEIKKTLNDYATAVKRVRESWNSNSKDREEFKSASKKFEKSLNKYLIRRDKREDPAVESFKHKSNRPYSEYRKETEVLIDPKQKEFPDSWRKAICAAEALSFASKMKEDPWAKSVRLTLASGHSISTWLDTQTVDPEKDKEDEKSLEEISTIVELPLLSKTQLQKKKERIIFWKTKISKAVPRKDDNLFQHPAILMAVKCIEEEYTKLDNKILVFGKFTRPMKALVKILNAREMVRRIDAGKLWPQYTLRGDEEKATIVALTQLGEGLSKSWDLNLIKKELTKNGKKFENSMRRFRRIFLAKLKEGFIKKELNTTSIHYKILEQLEIASNTKKGRDVFNYLTIACYELIYGLELYNDDELDPIELSDKYIEIIYALTDLDKETDDGKEEIEDEKLDSILEDLKIRLKEEYGTQIGKFARFMFGETKQHTRRLMQLAFNRPGSFPYVLVAQSRVGREGLNLHKACKTVLMLHPEWNPAVAEQQIGRVDRLGSLWSNLIEEFNGNPEDAPRIEIRPIIFKNTYDEQNWKVLRERWDDLRAQLHGIIIPDRIAAKCDAEEREIISELNGWAPNFAP